MPFPPDQSFLDIRQILQLVYDEDNRQIRTKAEATIVNADIDISLDSSEDSVAIKSSTGTELDIELDGSINTNSVDGSLEVTQQQILTELQNLNTSAANIESDIDQIRIATQSIDADIDVTLSTRASESTLTTIKTNTDRIAGNFLSGIDFDTLEISYTVTEDIHVYKLATITQSTITVTYTDSTKQFISTVVKT